MSQESRGNVFCIIHQCPLSECSDECPVKQGAKSTAQFNSKKVWVEALALPITDEQTEVDTAIRVAEQRERQKEQMTTLRAQQEELLKQKKKESPEGYPEEPKDS